eukprot:jgi/Botrbrau1/1571/Bobra.0107s0058.1
MEMFERAALANPTKATLQLSASRTSPVQDPRVFEIFHLFDSDSDGALSQKELENFIYAANPGVPFTTLQVEAIVAEVLEEYADFISNNGLTIRGLCQCYKDGVSDIGRDYRAVGLENAPENKFEQLQRSRPRLANEPLPQDSRISPFRDCTNMISSVGHNVVPVKSSSNSTGKPISPRRRSLCRSSRSPVDTENAFEESENVPIQSFSNPATSARCLVPSSATEASLATWGKGEDLIHGMAAGNHGDGMPLLLHGRGNDAKPPSCSDGGTLHDPTHCRRRSTSPLVVLDAALPQPSPESQRLTLLAESSIAAGRGSELGTAMHAGCEVHAESYSDSQAHSEEMQASLILPMNVESCPAIGTQVRQDVSSSLLTEIQSFPATCAEAQAQPRPMAELETDPANQTEDQAEATARPSSDVKVAPVLPTGMEEEGGGFLDQNSAKDVATIGHASEIKPGGLSSGVPHHNPSLLDSQKPQSSEVILKEGSPIWCSQETDSTSTSSSVVSLRSYLTSAPRTRTPSSGSTYSASHRGNHLAGSPATGSVGSSVTSAPSSFTLSLGSHASGSSGLSLSPLSPRTLFRDSATKSSSSYGTLHLAVQDSTSRLPMCWSSGFRTNAQPLGEVSPEKNADGAVECNMEHDDSPLDAPSESLSLRSWGGSLAGEDSPTSRAQIFKPEVHASAGGQREVTHVNPMFDFMSKAHMPRDTPWHICVSKSLHLGRPPQPSSSRSFGSPAVKGEGTGNVQCIPLADQVGGVSATLAGHSPAPFCTVASPGGSLFSAATTRPFQESKTQTSHGRVGNPVPCSPDAAEPALQPTVQSPTYPQGDPASLRPAQAALEAHRQSPVAVHSQPSATSEQGVLLSTSASGKDAVHRHPSPGEAHARLQAPVSTVLQSAKEGSPGAFGSSQSHGGPSADRLSVHPTPQSTVDTAENIQHGSDLGSPPPETVQVVRQLGEAGDNPVPPECFPVLAKQTEPQARARPPAPLQVRVPADAAPHGDTLASVHAQHQHADPCPSVQAIQPLSALPSQPEPQTGSPVSARRQWLPAESVSESATPEPAPSLLAAKAAWLDFQGGQQAVVPSGLLDPLLASQGPLQMQQQEIAAAHASTLHLGADAFAPGSLAGMAGGPEAKPSLSAVALKIAVRERAVREEASQRQQEFHCLVDSGLGFAKREQHVAAVASFRQALLIQPDNARCLFRLGNALYALRHLKQAEQAYWSALQRVQLPTEASLVTKIRVNLGITLEGQDRLLDACTQYREAVQMNPKHWRGMKLLGSALYALGDLPAARTALEFALQLKPDYADAHCDLGCTLCALDEAENACASFKAALALQPQHQEALFNLGNLHRQSGDFSSALECYEGVQKLDAKHWRAHLNRAVSLLGLGRAEEAQAALDCALEIGGGSGELEAELANLRLLSGSRAERDPGL